MSILMVSSDGGFGNGVIVNTGTGLVTNDALDFFSIQEAARLSTGEICTSVVNILGPLGIYTWNESTTAASFTLSATFAGGDVQPGYGININNDLFWGFLNLNVLDASFYKFGADGVIITTVGPVTGSDTGALFCVSIDETVAYYAKNSTHKIKRWDLTNNIALADLVTFNSNYFVSGMWNVQGSTDFVVAYNNWSGPGDNTRVLIRYTSAGAMVFTATYVTIPAPFEDDFSEVALSSDLLGIWTRDAGSPSYDITIDCQYNHVLFSDGSVIDTANIPVSDSGSPSTTCFLMELGSTTSFNYSGIYVIKAAKTADEYYTGTTGTTTTTVKMPNPTARLFPLGGG